MGTAGALGSVVAHAHFALESPPSWAEQDSLGSPQKSSPCGQADADTIATPTNVVTDLEAGQIIDITLQEMVFHPGHYRVVLSTTGPDGLPPDPEASIPGTCIELPIQVPPVFPVLADGLLPHTEPLEGPQTFGVPLPGDVTCTSCTLQVLEFMQADVGGGGSCFYHHCANITIAAPSDATESAAFVDDDGGGFTCAMGRNPPPPGAPGGLAMVLMLATLCARRRCYN